MVASGGLESEVKCSRLAGYLGAPKVGALGDFGLAMIASLGRQAVSPSSNLASILASRSFLVLSSILLVSSAISLVSLT